MTIANLQNYALCLTPDFVSGLTSLGLPFLRSIIYITTDGGGALAVLFIVFVY